MGRAVTMFEWNGAKPGCGNQGDQTVAVTSPDPSRLLPGQTANALCSADIEAENLDDSAALTQARQIIQSVPGAGFRQSPKFASGKAMGSRLLISES